MDSNELLRRYVHAVGGQLPKRLRGDVEVELRTLLDEGLEERAAHAGRPADEAMTVKLLEELGSPDTVAARYLPPSYLVGPENYPAFVLIAKIGLAVLGTLFLVLFVQRVLAAPAEAPEMARAAWSTLVGLGSYALINLGLLVVVFAVIERWSGTRKGGPADTSWNARDLPAVEDRRRINRAAVVTGIALDFGLIALLNLFPQLVAYFIYTGDAWGKLPLLAPEFRAEQVPWITILLLLDIGVNAVVLRRGRWEPATRVGELGVSVVSAIVLLRILQGGAILVPAVFTGLVKTILAVVLVIDLIEVCEQLYRLLNATADQGVSPEPEQAHA